MRDQDELRKLVDRDGVSLPEAVGAYGVDLDTAIEARSELTTAVAYLELHIEQGPVLETLDLPLGPVLGTFGVERHRITWTGQAAHAGSTPMDARRDALAGAAKLALVIRDVARETGDGAVCTSGGVVCKPGIVTSVVETAEQLLDQRHLDAGKLAGMLELARIASERFAVAGDSHVDTHVTLATRDRGGAGRVRRRHCRGGRREAARAAAGRAAGLGRRGNLPGARGSGAAQGRLDGHPARLLQP